MRAPPVAVLMLLMIGLAAGSQAQLSPGELSSPHAELDSSRSCPDCHATGRGVTAELCLSCHTLIAERIQAGAGLHARPDYRRCETCHIEHHGREFELVWWGEEGIGSFDHRETGHTLEGAHRVDDCRTCHQASNIARPAPLLAAGKDLGRTFLGLDAACAGCHDDAHRGQMAPRACSGCHGQDAWRPAPGFDHARTDFPLDGRHARVDCAECHATETDDAGSWVRYADVSTACADCHQDPHAGRLGRDCAACHTTADWNRVDTTRFNHDLTRFPLSGRHTRVDCAGCHSAGTFRVAGFDACETCHADVHAGQFFGREAAGGATGCAECHDTSGFVPSRFDLADHAATRFPLDGAHASVACADCHGVVVTADLVARGDALATPDAPASVRDFSIEVSGCVDCHRDPHAGTADAFLGTVGCVSCHDGNEDWHTVTFDHDATGYPLEGAHATVACAQCHRGVVVASPGRVDPDVADATDILLSFDGAPTVCRDCHDDPHLGQFDEPASPADCRRCHSPEGWTPPLFDHDRDSRFALEGAHARAECGACHFVEALAGGDVVRYKPLPTVCSGCHVVAKPPHPDPLSQGGEGTRGRS